MLRKACKKFKGKIDNYEYKKFVAKIVKTERGALTF